MKETPMVECDWEVFDKNHRDAKGYHFRAEQFAREGQRPSLIFNVASVAIERYLVALCAYRGIMPFNHNYTSLMDAAESAVAFDQELSKNIRSLDEIFGICSLEEYHHGTPTPADSVRALSMCNNILKMFDRLEIKSINTDPA